MTKEIIELISNWVTILSLPIAVIAIIVAVGQFVYSKKIEEAKFWLDLRQIFSIHNEIHLNLRNGGLWSKNGSGPQSIAEWAKVDAYLGLFEICLSMLKKKLISDVTFKSQYDYRLFNIVQNDIIVSKIKSEANDWKDFIELCQRFSYNI